MNKLTPYIGLRGGVSKRAYEKLVSFRQDVERAFPDQVTEIVLFGSRARGDAHRDSDYDIAVFVEVKDENAGMNRRLSEIAYPYLLDGVHIAPVWLPAEFLTNAGVMPLAHAIAREGMVLS